MTLHRNRTFSIALLILFTTLFALACSDDEGSSQNPSTTSTNTTPDAGSTSTDAGEDTETDTGETDADTPLTIPEGCNPVAASWDCMLPYPSDTFLVDDPSLPSGKRVSLTDAAKPATKDNQTFDFMDYHEADGFSRNMPIQVYIPQGLDPSNLIFHTDDPTQSLQPSNATLLINAQTGALVPHWAEVDKFTDDPTTRVLILRPYIQLDEQTRYIVALQNLIDPSGNPISPPDEFQHLLDNPSSSHPTLASVSTHYEANIFPPITALGVQRSSLVLAWDFTTGSEEHATRDMLAMRNDAITRFEATPPAVTVTTVTPDFNDQIALRIEGTISVPLYLESTSLGALLHRDENGVPTVKETAEVPFTMQVPYSAMPTEGEDFSPAPIMQYGHGFFGKREEINYGFMRRYSNERRYITIAVDWWGMSEDDVAQVAQDLTNNIGHAFTFVDRLQQSVINMIALSYAIQGPLKDIAELKTDDDTLLYNPELFYYYGISQGHIFGVPMIALNPLLERSVLGVGGGSYSLMMSRASSFQQFMLFIDIYIANPVTTQKLIALSQHTWDRIDPMSYASHLLQDPYPNSPQNRTVLMHMGVHDHSVNNLASDLLARAIGAPMIGPSVRDIYTLESVSGPHDGSALQVFDFQVENPPGIDAKLPSEEQLNDVHDGLRDHPPVKDQIDAFLQPNGVIQNFCDGPCDPE